MSNFVYDNAGSGVGAFAGESGDLPEVTWSDGSPVTSEATDDPAGSSSTRDLEQSFSLTTAATTQVSTLTLLVNGFWANTELTATLSNGSAPAAVLAFSGRPGSDSLVYEIEFSADTPGQTLDLAFTTVGNANSQTLPHRIQAAALMIVVPEPSSLAIGGIGGMLLLTRRASKRGRSGMPLSVRQPSAGGGPIRREDILACRSGIASAPPPEMERLASGSALAGGRFLREWRVVHGRLSSSSHAERAQSDRRIASRAAAVVMSDPARSRTVSGEPGGSGARLHLPERATPGRAFGGRPGHTCPTPSAPEGAGVSTLQRTGFACLSSAQAG